MSFNGFRCDAILVAEKCRHFEAIEMAALAIPLQCSNGAGVASARVAICNLFDCQRVLVVVGRDRSRRVVTHAPDDNSRRETSRSGYPQWGSETPLQRF